MREKNVFFCEQKSKYKLSFFCLHLENGWDELNCTFFLMPSKVKLKTLVKMLEEKKKVHNMGNSWYIQNIWSSFVNFEVQLFLFLFFL